MTYSTGWCVRGQRDNKKCTRLQMARRRMGKIYDVIVKSPNVKGKNMTL